MPNLHALFLTYVFAATLLAAVVAEALLLWRSRRELERHAGAIRRLWRDRDQLRAEVNGLRHSTAETLAKAGLAPEVKRVTAFAVDVEPCHRCGTLEGERVGNICRECDRELNPEGGAHGSH